MTVLAPSTERPRLGFLGVGWIGRHRLEALAQSGSAVIAAVVDPADDIALALPDVPRLASLEALLQSDVDGIVIATPSAMHAEQAIAALERGKAVFCQKPLGRTAAECRRVVEAAEQADRLLAVDFGYRLLNGVQRVRQLVQQGELGRVYAVELAFHNAYGPDKPWFYDPRISGGGCVIDLGVHLVDLALWLLDYPRLETTTSRLYSKGRRLGGRPDVVEDFALATLEFAGEVSVRLACSWHVPAGRPAVIELRIFGTRGGAGVHNVNGSFFDFIAERYRGTERELIAAPPDSWAGRAAIAWARRLTGRAHFDPDNRHLVTVAQAIDAIYGRQET